MDRKSRRGPEASLGALGLRARLYLGSPVASGGGVLDPVEEIRQEAAVELAAIYARHERETRKFFEALGERLRAHGLTEEQIFGEVMEVIRAVSPQEAVSNDEES
jgi:hypothetical protein